MKLNYFCIYTSILCIGIVHSQNHLAQSVADQAYNIYLTQRRLKAREEWRHFKNMDCLTTPAQCIETLNSLISKYEEFSTDFDLYATNKYISEAESLVKQKGFHLSFQKALTEIEDKTSYIDDIIQLAKRMQSDEGIDATLSLLAQPASRLQSSAHSLITLNQKQLEQLMKIWKHFPNDSVLSELILTQLTEHQLNIFAKDLLAIARAIKDDSLIFSIIKSLPQESIKAHERDIIQVINQMSTYQLRAISALPEATRNDFASEVLQMILENKENRDGQKWLLIYFLPKDTIAKNEAVIIDIVKQMSSYQSQVIGTLSESTREKFSADIIGIAKKIESGEQGSYNQLKIIEKLPKQSRMKHEAEIINIIKKMSHYQVEAIETLPQASIKRFSSDFIQIAQENTDHDQRLKILLKLPGDSRVKFSKEIKQMFRGEQAALKKLLPYKMWPRIFWNKVTTKFRPLQM